MKVLLATFQVELINIKSLKEKRSIVKKVSNEFRKKFNIAIIESGFNDNKKIFQFTLSTLSNDVDYLLSFYEKMEDIIEYKFGLRVINSDYEIL
ncbi:DUF503 family protein [Marinitoga sp. 38H-ov]|uniref:DUF503 domain-containing protein n=1 Tax=Marinitoga sp. 38H-ov TaxID=1755814 RepID=UPI0013ED9CBF|nr:DUF503 family protein [Marinitoga sp. 38H-ov]KAF2956046.1 hypothetical protein AS160_07740 [Marinitoga sp. 38H-ov]